MLKVISSWAFKIDFKYDELNPLIYLNIKSRFIMADLWSLQCLNKDPNIQKCNTVDPWTTWLRDTMENLPLIYRLALSSCGPLGPGLLRIHYSQSTELTTSGILEKKFP